MIVGVWFKNRYWCEKWFTDFLNKINYDAVDRVIRSKVQPPRIIMKNGNYIIGIPAIENSLGNRMNIAYLEPGVRELEIFDYVIQPTIIASFGYKKGEIYEGFYGGQVKLDQVP